MARKKLEYYAVTKLYPPAPTRVIESRRTFQAFSADGAALQFAREIGAKLLWKVMPFGKSKLTGAYQAHGGNLEPGIYHFGVVRFKVGDRPPSVDKRALAMRQKAWKEKGIVEEWEDIHPPGEPPTFVNTESQEYRRYRSEIDDNPSRAPRRIGRPAKRNPSSKKNPAPDRMRDLRKLTRV